MLFSKDFVYKCNASLNMSHIICVLNCSLLNKAYCKTHCCWWCKGWSAVPSPLEKYCWRAQFLLPIDASKKVILTVNFKRCLIQSRPFWKRRQPVFPLLISFVYSVIVVFCRYICTRLWSPCWRRCLHCAKRCSLCFVVVVFFDPLTNEFSSA